MINESAADRQAAQQAREQEKKYADSATAVSPDTERADPTPDGEDGSLVGGSGATGGYSSRGTSTVFDESDPEDIPRARAGTAATADADAIADGDRDS